MEIAIFPPEELPTALGVVRALQPGANTTRDRFVRAIGRLHGVRIDLATLPSPSFKQAATVIADPVRRKRVVQLAVVCALLGGELDEGLESDLGRLCQVLGVDDAAIRAGHAMLSSNRAIWTTAVGAAS